MQLAPIARDRHPTDEELTPYLKSEHGLPLLNQQSFQVGVAKFLWKIRCKSQSPDDFLVPFANQIKIFPDSIKSYRDYLVSDLWISIRSKILLRSKGLCECCGKQAKHVHHRDYRPRVLQGNDLGALVALCQNCHSRIHKDPKTKKPYNCWNDTEAALAKLFEHGFKKTH